MTTWKGTANAAFIAAIVGQREGRFCVAARHLVTGEEILYNADHLCAAASVFKVPLLVELIRQAENGDLSWNERLTLTHRSKCHGSGVLKDMEPGRQFTLRRLAHLMITRSDNTAADLVLGRVGGAANVTHTMRRIGLANTHVNMGCKTLLNHYDLARRSVAENNSTTPWDMVNLLEKLYQKDLFSAKGCETVLNIMKKQRFRSRIPRKLPKGVVTANKTGSLDGYVANDIGIVWPDQVNAYALAIFASYPTPVIHPSGIVADISLGVYRYFTTGRA